MYLVLSGSGQLGGYWKLSAKPIVIGRAGDCDICLRDPRLSRRHVKLWFEEGRIHFKDLDSSNSTLVNNIPATAGELKPGDLLGAGGARFHIAESLEDIENGRSRFGKSTITMPAVQDVYEHVEDDTPTGQSRNGAVHELHNLFRLGLELGEIEDMAALGVLLESTLRVQFDPDAIWIAWRYDDAASLTFHQGENLGETEPHLVELLDRATNHKLGEIVQYGESESCRSAPGRYMTVPFLHDGSSVGGFIMRERAQGQRGFGAAELQYALAIAAMTAPHVRLIRHTENLRRDNQMLTERLGGSTRLLGTSEPMVQTRLKLIRAALSRLPVLIVGETGTGKEIAARMLHEESERRFGPFVVVNCAAIPSNLFESEFFGFERGAFTGADQRRIGRFEEAHGGTVFLDEIGDLSLDNQARILRLVETNAFHRIGGNQLIEVDVRIVAATNKPLEEPIFRRDLLHRLNAVTIEMPPLRDRIADIKILAQFFIRTSDHGHSERVSGVRADAINLLEKYSWPGNVRELRAVIERAMLFAAGPELTPDDFELGVPIDGDTPGNANRGPYAMQTLAAVERDHIERVLAACGGNVSEASRVLGINRVTLHKRINKYKKR